MLSLSSLGALFFRGGLVRKVITGYSGDTFPNFTPNPWFAGAYERGEVEVEHWSFLAFSQRLEAGARGLPAIVTRSIAGSSMEANDGVRARRHAVRRGRAARAARARRRAPARAVADRDGNVALHPPLLEGVWGALGARRGAIVTVERIVDDVRPWSHLVRIPAHRVLAVVECPMGAHPGGLLRRRRSRSTATARTTTSGSTRAPRPGPATSYDEWIRHWVLDVETQEQWLDRLGAERVADAAGQGRSRLVARRRGRVPARSRRAGERVGARRGVGRAPPRRAGRRAPAPTRCSRARASRTSRRGSACSSRATRVRT